MSRFDYVKYDDESLAAQTDLKCCALDLEAKIDEHLEIGSLAHAYAMKSLEETYMWCGKGIRNRQIVRNGGADLQEERGEDEFSKAKGGTKQ